MCGRMGLGERNCVDSAIRSAYRGSRPLRGGAESEFLWRILAARNPNHVHRQEPSDAIARESSGICRSFGPFSSSFCRKGPGRGQKTIRVLFIGNSLTDFNDLPAQLQTLVSEAYPSGRSLRYESITPGGCTLQKHWNDGKAAARITQGHWDYVVLQEQSQIPFSDRQQMYHYARLFDREIKKVGAKTVLYMTFPLQRKFVHGDEMPVRPPDEKDD
jgi:hypothetical protein